MIPTGGTLAEALKFYTEQMGFLISWAGDTGAGIVRDNVSLNLVVNTNREWIENFEL
jgi:hypothetical protein